MAANTDRSVVEVDNFWIHILQRDLFSCELSGGSEIMKGNASLNDAS